jgi:Do/DeqQ family serine protease
MRARSLVAISFVLLAIACGAAEDPQREPAGDARVAQQAPANASRPQPAPAGLPPPVTVGGHAPGLAAGALPSLAPIVELATPAVVNIAVISRSPEEDNPLLQDPWFRRFFGVPDRPRTQQSAGSGVIVDAANGYVLTNHHVINNAVAVKVILKDKREFDAKLVGSDAGTDIALLRIEAQALSAVKLGDSDRLNVGDYVLAIGNPFGIGQTVTSGIVSAVGRSGLNIEGYEDFIQTDASINPGNSGGALINLRGELVGVNTAIIGPSGGNIGIGFAVPVNMARAVMRQLAKYGEMRRGWFGVSAQDLTPDLAQALRAKANEGAVIVEVEPGSPAERAGVRKGDVVQTVNARTLRGSGDLRNQLGLLAVGDDVRMRLLREGKALEVKGRIEKVPMADASEMERVPELSGAVVGNVRRGNLRGVLVAEVEAGSPAWNRGLRPGDVIVAVNRKATRSVRELMQLLRGDDRLLLLNVVRGDYLLTIRIRR